MDFSKSSDDQEFRCANHRGKKEPQVARHRKVVTEEQCPVWCESHGSGENSADHMHVASCIQVDCIEPQREHDDEATPPRASGVTFNLLRYRYVGDNEDWVRIGAEGDGRVVTLESARRLSKRLEEYLNSGE